MLAGSVILVVETHLATTDAALLSSDLAMGLPGARLWRARASLALKPALCRLTMAAHC